VKYYIGLAEEIELESILTVLCGLPCKPCEHDTGARARCLDQRPRDKRRVSFSCPKNWERVQCSYQASGSTHAVSPNRKTNTRWASWFACLHNRTSATPAPASRQGANAHGTKMEINMPVPATTRVEHRRPQQPHTPSNKYTRRVRRGAVSQRRRWTCHRP